MPQGERHRCDVAVIGAGTAGIAAERSARAQGATTRLIDPRFAGTTCATVGCMPSKLLIAAADAANTASDAARFGISTTVRVDGPAVMSRLRRRRDEFAAGVRRSLEALPDGTLIKAKARFVDPTTLELDTGGRVEAGAVVIATGARPAIPGAFADVEDRVLTNEPLFEQEDLPASVGVIGGGPEGVELAQALARLGVEVTLFDAGETLAGLPEPLSGTLREILSEEMTLHLNTAPEAVSDGDGVLLRWAEGSRRVDRLLVAAGRPAALDGLGLAVAGIVLDDDDAPRFDRRSLQCGDLPVFIAGDANGHRPVLHEAAAEGAVAGRNAASYPDCAAGRRHVPLAITFTRPEAAVIGRLPGEDEDSVTATADFGDQGRAVVEGRAAGALRLHADHATGRLTGAALCAPGGEHLAHLLAWAIAQDLAADEVLRFPFYHPTLEEGMRPALREICRRTNRASPWDRDDAKAPGG